MPDPVSTVQVLNIVKRAIARTKGGLQEHNAYRVWAAHYLRGRANRRPRGWGLENALPALRDELNEALQPYEIHISLKELQKCERVRNVRLLVWDKLHPKYRREVAY